MEEVLDRETPAKVVVVAPVPVLPSEFPAVTGFAVAVLKFCEIRPDEYVAAELVWMIDACNDPAPSRVSNTTFLIFKLNPSDI